MAIVTNTSLTAQEVMSRLQGVSGAQKKGALAMAKEASRTEFLDKFEKIKSEKVKEELQQIFDKITVQSDKIGEKIYLNDLIEYKKLVREFLDVAVKNSHQFMNENFLDRCGRHRVYSTVKKVDRELDGITTDFINNQLDHVGLLKKMDDIKGILLDIMM